MNYQHSDLLSTSVCPGSDVLRQYQDGLLTAEQSRFVEMHLADCEMCSDELDGMSLIETSELEKRTSTINKAIKRKLRMKDRRIILLDYRLMAAASVLLLLGLMFYWNKKTDFSSPHHIAQEMHQPEMEKNSNTSSALLDNTESDGDRTRAQVKPSKTDVKPLQSNEPHQQYSTENASTNEKSVQADDLGTSDLRMDNEKSDLILQNEKSHKAKENLVQLPQLLGIVKDPTGYPIPGATIVIKGTNIGTISNLDGKFKLDTSGMKNISIIVTMIGFDKQELAVNNKLKDTLRVNLVEESIRLDEVVVVGYGTQKKKQATGSVSKSNFLDFLKPQSEKTAILSRDPKLIIAEEMSKAQQFESYGMLDSALSYYKKVVQLEPKHTKAQLSIIYCYLKTDRSAIAEYKISELLNMKNFDPLKTNLLQVKKLMGDEEDKKAIQLINRMRH